MLNNSSDLVALLRNAAKESRATAFDVYDLCLEAANLIEALQEENRKIKETCYSQSAVEALLEGGTNDPK